MTDLPPLSPDERLRYARHLTLPEVGEAGQRRLKAARVLVVGAGGLGSPAALYLAAAGVGCLGIADFDVVETSNLQRQVLHGTAALGRPKVDSAAARLRDVNPTIRVQPHPIRLDRASAPELVAQYDIVVDGSDNFATRYLLNDVCALLGRPYVYGAIYRFEGQVAVFWAGHGPCYRCLFQEPPPPDLVPTCAQGGVLGVLPGIVGSWQALEALKLLLGIGQPLLGRLAIFDGLAGRWREVAVPRASDCPVCGVAPTIRSVEDLIDYEAFCGVPSSDTTPAVEPPAVAAQLRQGVPLLLLDVRRPDEWSVGNLSAYGAIHIPLDELPTRLAEIPRDRPVVTVCRSGQRAQRAAALLRAHGIPAAVLRGGLEAWARTVDPSLPVA